MAKKIKRTANKTNSQKSDALLIKQQEHLMKQQEQAWLNFDRRRAYEWKLSFGIWTALAAFVGLTLRGDAAISIGLCSAIALMVVGLLILGLHCVFYVYYLRANAVDQSKGRLYEARLNEELKVDFGETPAGKKLTAQNEVKTAQDDVAKAIARVRGAGGLFPGGKWAAFVHLGITMVLLFAAAAVVIQRSQQERPLPLNVSYSNPVIQVGGQWRPAPALLNATELAALLREEGLPCRKSGAGDNITFVYPTEEVVKWVREHWGKNKGKPAGS